MNDYVLVILLILLVLRIFFKDKETFAELKKLSAAQLTGVILTYLVTLVAITVLIYYGGNAFAGLFNNIFLQAFSFLVIVFVVLASIGTAADRVLNRITDGRFPIK